MPIPPPAGLNWDLWLGPAPLRPYLGNYKEGKFKGRPVYQPFAWRGWWDFGTGALGDMGCHLLDALFSVLKIKHVEAVELVKDSGDGTPEMFPTSSIIRWDVPGQAGAAPCKVFWYDGGYLPPRQVADLGPQEEYPTQRLRVGRPAGEDFQRVGAAAGGADEAIQDPQAEHPPLPKQPLRRMGHGLQGRAARLLELRRPRRPLERNGAAGQSGDPGGRGPKTPLGRPQHEMHQPPGGQPVSPPPIPKGLDPIGTFREKE